MSSLEQVFRKSYHMRKCRCGGVSSAQQQVQYHFTSSAPTISCLPLSLTGPFSMLVACDSSYLKALILPVRTIGSYNCSPFSRICTNPSPIAVMPPNPPASTTAPLLRSMARIYHTGTASDVTVVCREREWKMHSWVLNQCELFEATVSDPSQLC